MSNVEDGVKMSEEMNLTGQNDTKKVDNKVRKLKTLLGKFSQLFSWLIKVTPIVWGELMDRNKVNKSLH